MGKTTRLAVMVAVVGAAACATRAARSSGIAGGEPAPVITVRNDNWLDVAVYLVRGTSRLRIGTVSSTTSRTFRIPLEGIGTTPLQVLADPIGENRQYVTDPVVLSPGQRLEVKVGSPLSFSSFAIWNR